VGRAEWVATVGGLHPNGGSVSETRAARKTRNRISPVIMTDRAQESLLAELGGPPRAALERLIYVVGAARGGSSITQAVIGQHDRVIALPGPSSFLNHVWRTRNRVHDRLWRQLLWTPSYLRRAAVRDSLSEPKSRAYVQLINRATARKDLHDLYRLYPLTRAFDPGETRDPSSFVAWLDKGNDFWGVDALPKAFPEARFVFVVRDPRGAVASLAKRTADLRPDTAFTVEPRDVIETALYWRNLARRQLRFARRHPDRTIFFRFEDLTARPVEIARLLYDALGLPAVAEAEIEARLDGLIYSASNETEQGAGISTAPNERWRKNLDRVALDLVSEICARSARRFGYELPPPAQRRGWAGTVRLVPGRKERAKTLAKLAFLAATDRAARAGRAAPAMRLLAEDRR
jgi:Sulfotransferase family